MMEMKHTKGKWIADIRTGCFAIVPEEKKENCLSGASETAIAFQSGRGEESQPGGYRYLTEEQEANAKLMAASPELLEELMTRCNMTGGLCGDYMSLEYPSDVDISFCPMAKNGYCTAWKAICKATGHDPSRPQNEN